MLLLLLPRVVVVATAAGSHALELALAVQATVA
jgi:hypothetical protein